MSTSGTCKRCRCTYVWLWDVRRADARCPACRGPLWRADSPSGRRVYQVGSLDVCRKGSD
jgi:hypothetical protein